ncbi:hypothetical protein [Tabrizicola soli]|uniref:Uncharacterized protein n=1 Tax=Tabrizicola soli TaxID=2185115 RepID=A0ABV7DZY7_9RHOB|nr:hypothetical protein [Tabrizicola soli]
MTDPFTFSLDRLRIRAIPREDNTEHIQWAYLLPAGGELVRDLFRFMPDPRGGILGGGGGGVGGAFYDHSSRYPFGLPEEARPLWVEFRAHVAQLTAHQRLAWMAAAQAEQVAP